MQSHTEPRAPAVGVDGSPPSGCVYSVRMSRMNVYVPDELAKAARDSGLNISALTQEAIAAALRRSATTTWLATLPTTPTSGIDHEQAMDALERARDDLDV